MMSAMRESPGSSIMGMVATAMLAAFFAISCSSSSPPTGVAPTGTQIDGKLGGTPFVVADVLLIHPQAWKGAASGATAVLISDTPNLCAQITSGKSTAPARMLIVLGGRVHRDADAGDVHLDEPGNPFVAVRQSVR
jgi:hypothetical protein